MSENEQLNVMASELVLSTVEIPRPVIEKDVTVEEDIKRAWRQGLAIKRIQKKFCCGTNKWIRDLVKYTKRKGDINKNGILIIQDYSKNKGPDGRPVQKFYPKKD